jgi:hypothetical protein
MPTLTVGQYHLVYNMMSLAIAAMLGFLYLLHVRPRLGLFEVPTGLDHVIARGDHRWLSLLANLRAWGRGVHIARERLRRQRRTLQRCVPRC